MRELKFRCWNRSAGVMQSWEDMKNHGDIFALLANSGSYPLNQHTGLMDNTGKYFYEGDIVKWGDNIESVYYSEEDACFQTKTSMLCGDTMKIIGNIYENPDLLSE